MTCGTPGVVSLPFSGAFGLVSLPWPFTTSDVEKRERARIVFELNCILISFDLFVLDCLISFLIFFVRFDFVCLLGFDLIVLILVV